MYVPNSDSNTVDVIDPRRFKVVDHFAVGALPQHVTPSWDLKTLYVLNDEGNSVTPIDPRTAKPGRPIHVDDPYNMYFTPDGRFAIVVAERLNRLDFSDPHTFRVRHALTVPCRGVDHMDFSANGGYLLASCEFSGQLIKVDLRSQRVVGVLSVPGGGMPQDVKLSPDGKVFYVADMHANGLWEVDGRRLRVIGFLPTGLGVHGLYPSRDGKLLYATNRSAGTISVISFRTRKVVATWRIPGGSPDMGNVSANGQGPLAVGPLRRGGVRDLDPHGPSARADPRRLRAARALRLAAARAALPGAHRNPPLKRKRPAGCDGSQSTDRRVLQELRRPAFSSHRCRAALAASGSVHAGRVPGRCR